MISRYLWFPGWKNLFSMFPSFWCSEEVTLLPKNSHFQALNVCTSWLTTTEHHRACSHLIPAYHSRHHTATTPVTTQPHSHSRTRQLDPPILDYSDLLLSKARAIVLRMAFPYPALGHRTVALLFWERGKDTVLCSHLLRGDGLWREPKGGTTF